MGYSLRVDTMIPIIINCLNCHHQLHGNCDHCHRRHHPSNDNDQTGAMCVCERQALQRPQY